MNPEQLCSLLSLPSMPSIVEGAVPSSQAQTPIFLIGIINDCITSLLTLQLPNLLEVSGF